MRLLAGCVVSLAAAGCAQLVGIDDTNDSARAGNTVALTRVSIGATVLTSPLDLTGLRANYLVANAASASGYDRVAATDGGGGKWTSLLRMPSPVEVTLPDLPMPLPRLFDFPSSKLSVLYSSFEHPGRTRPPDPATIAFTVALDTAYVVGERFQVYTVGSWTTRAFAAADVPGVGTTQIGPVTYAFSSSTSQSGRSELDRLTSQDVFLVLRYNGAALTGAAVAPAFDQTGNDSLMATMMPVIKDHTLDVKIAPAALATRYMGVRPAVANLAMSWSLVAAPGYRLASNTGPVLNSGGLTASDVGVSLQYGNPFVDRQWNTIFTLATSESRVFTPVMPALPVTLYAGMNQFLEPSTSDTVKLDAGLPITISIDGTPLSTDGKVISPPTKFLSVTFDRDNRNNTLYGLTVYDLVPNAGGTALDYRFVFDAASKEAAFQLPPELFQTGHSYTMRASSLLGGFPGAASGDLSMRELPLSQSYLDGPVITVMP